MSYQTPLSIEEQQLIESELETLFACQGKHLSAEMKSIWVNEIDKSSIPTGAVLQGLRLLKAEDLTHIKLGTVFGACRRFVEATEVSGCEYCHAGYVIMKDDQNRSFSLKCRCAAGNTKNSQGLAAWNGEETQFLKDRMLTRT